MCTDTLGRLNLYGTNLNLRLDANETLAIMEDGTTWARFRGINNELNIAGSISASGDLHLEGDITARGDIK